MCQRVTCSTCGKPGWKGCGAHVEQILGDVDPADRCACDGGSTTDGLLARVLRIFGG